MWHETFKIFVKEIRKDFKNAKKKFKTEMNHDEIDEETLAR